MALALPQMPAVTTFTTAACHAYNATTSTLPSSAKTPACAASFFNAETPPSLESNLQTLSVLSQNPTHKDAIQDALYKPGNALYRLFFGSGSLEERTEVYSSLGRVVNAHSRFSQTGNNAINSLDSTTLEEAADQVADQVADLISKLTQPKAESSSFFQQLGALSELTALAAASADNNNPTENT